MRIVSIIVVLALTVVGAVCGWAFSSQSAAEYQQSAYRAQDKVSELKTIISNLYDDKKFKAHTSVMQAYLNRAKSRPGTQKALKLLEGDTFDVLKANLFIAQGLPECAALNIASVENGFDLIAQRIEDEISLQRKSTNGQNLITEKEEMEFLVGCANNVLTSDLNISYVDDDAVKPELPWHVFLHGITQKKRGTCVTMALAWKVLGDKLDWPLQVRTIPRHVYITWVDEGIEANIEATAYAASVSDKKYISDGKVTQQQRDDKIWMADLGPQRLLSLFLCNRADSYHSLGNLQRAFEDLLLAAELDPKCIPARRMMAIYWPDIAPSIEVDVVTEFEGILGPEITAYGQKLSRERRLNTLAIERSKARVERERDRVRRASGIVPDHEMPLYNSTRRSNDIGVFTPAGKNP